MSSKSPGDVLRRFAREGQLRECSIFIDESGGQGGHSRYYILALIFHDQAESLRDCLRYYRKGLQDKSLDDIPFHAGPLMNGHESYQGLDLRTRKGYLSQFFLTFQHLPIRYHAFVYRRSEFSSNRGLSDRMRRDMANLLFDNLGYFQSFDRVDIYYDNGQEIVAQAVRGAVEYALSKEGVLYKSMHQNEYFLAQVADLVCALELAAVKYRNKEATRTDEKFFGSNKSFRQNYLKALKRKRLMP